MTIFCFPSHYPFSPPPPLPLSPSVRSLSQSLPLALSTASCLTLSLLPSRKPVGPRHHGHLGLLNLLLAPGEEPPPYLARVQNFLHLPTRALGDFFALLLRSGRERVQVGLAQARNHVPQRREHAAARRGRDLFRLDLLVRRDAGGVRVEVVEGEQAPLAADLPELADEGPGLLSGEIPVFFVFLGVGLEGGRGDE